MICRSPVSRKTRILSRTKTSLPLTDNATGTLSKDFPCASASSASSHSLLRSDDTQWNFVIAQLSGPCGGKANIFVSLHLSCCFHALAQFPQPFFRSTPTSLWALLKPECVGFVSRPQGAATGLETFIKQPFSSADQRCASNIPIRCHTTQSLSQSCRPSRAWRWHRKHSKPDCQRHRMRQSDPRNIPNSL